MSSNSTLLSALKMAEDLPPVDPSTCRLLGPFALAVQAVMGIFVALSLVLKRFQERPRRKWRVWFGDVSKQVVGQAFIHASNILISDQIAMHHQGNACSYYATNIIVDTTLGVLILYFVLRGFVSLAIQHDAQSYQSGFYGDPFSFVIWGKQTSVYIAAVVVMKIVVVALFWIAPALEDLVSWMLELVRDEHIQVFLTMMLLPVVMNVLQFLLIDSFIREKPGKDAFEDEPEEVRQHFLGDSEDEDEDDEDPGASDGLGVGAGHRRLPSMNESELAREEEAIGLLPPEAAPVGPADPAYGSTTKYAYPPVAPMPARSSSTSSSVRIGGHAKKGGKRSRSGSEKGSVSSVVMGTLLPTTSREESRRGNEAG